MERHTIIRLTDRPEYKESMAQWFHEKWGIPKQAYLDSMDACLKGESAVPQWYAVVEDGRIIGGLGVPDLRLSRPADDHDLPVNSGVA